MESHSYHQIQGLPQPIQKIRKPAGRTPTLHNRLSAIEANIAQVYTLISPQAERFNMDVLMALQQIACQIFEIGGREILKVIHPDTPTWIGIDEPSIAILYRDSNYLTVTAPG